MHYSKNCKEMEKSGANANAPTHELDEGIDRKKEKAPNRNI